MAWQIIHAGLMCAGRNCFYSRCVPLCVPRRLRASHQTTSTATEHFASPVLRRGTICHPTFVLHQHSLVSTRSSADAENPARRVYRSVKVTKHSTIPYARYSFLLCNRNSVFKTRRFYDIRLQKCRDLEIRVRGHIRSLEVVSLYRLGVVSY